MENDLEARMTRYVIAANARQTVVDQVLGYLLAVTHRGDLATLDRLEAAWMANLNFQAAAMPANHPAAHLFGEMEQAQSIASILAHARVEARRLG